MTIEWLCLFLHFSHGFVNKKNIILVPFKHILLDMMVLLAILECLNTTWPPLSHYYGNSHIEGLTIDLTPIIHFSMEKTIEGTNINIFYNLLSYWNPSIICGLNKGLRD